jgi:hypothetical protein
MLSYFIPFGLISVPPYGLISEALKYIFSVSFPKYLLVCAVCALRIFKVETFFQQRLCG